MGPEHRFFCAEKTSSSDGSVDYKEAIPLEEIDLAATAASISPPSWFIMPLLPIKTELRQWEMQLYPAGCNSPPSDSNRLTLTSQSSYFLSDECLRRLLCVCAHAVVWLVDRADSLYRKILFSRIATAYELNMTHFPLFCMHPYWCLGCLCFCWVMVVLFQPMEECHCVFVKFLKCLWLSQCRLQSADLLYVQTNTAPVG